MTLISVVHATRGRSRQAFLTRIEWLRRGLGGGVSLEHKLVVDRDDADSLSTFDPAILIVVPPRGGNAAYNAGARQVAGEVIVVSADDVLPPLGWARLVLERLGDVSVPKVLAVSDGHRTDKLLAHPILTRARLEQQGGNVFDPIFPGVYGDSDFTEAAYRDGVVVEARDLVFEHRHPSFGTAEWDDGYRRQNDPNKLAEGYRLFRERWPRSEIK